MILSCIWSRWDTCVVVKPVGVLFNGLTLHWCEGRGCSHLRRTSDSFATSSLLIGVKDQCSLKWSSFTHFQLCRLAWVGQLRQIFVCVCLLNRGGEGAFLSLFLPTSPALILLVRPCNHDNTNAWICLHYWAWGLAEWAAVVLHSVSLQMQGLCFELWI